MIANIILAIRHLHTQNILYRDPKPENILIGEDGYLSLCDFGLSKIMKSQDDISRSFKGTPEYLAPELIKGIGHSYKADWWSIGMITYEMLIGIPPFYNKDKR